MELDVDFAARAGLATKKDLETMIRRMTHKPYRRRNIPAIFSGVVNAQGIASFRVFDVPDGMKYEVERYIVWGDNHSPGSGGTYSGTTQTNVDNSATGAATAIAATLAAAAGATTYITGFEVTGTGATAGSTIVVTVTGILGGTLSYELAIPAGVGTPINPLIVEFPSPIPASALNTAIVVNVPSFGAGNTNAAVTAHGFQQTTVNAWAGIFHGLPSPVNIADFFPMPEASTGQVLPYLKEFNGFNAPLFMAPDNIVFQLVGGPVGENITCLCFGTLSEINDDDRKRVPKKGAAAVEAQAEATAAMTT